MTLGNHGGQQECSPAGCTHGISLHSNSHPEQPIIKKKPSEGFSLHTDAERGTVTFTQTYCVKASPSLQTLLSLLPPTDPFFSLSYRCFQFSPGNYKKK